MAPIIYKHNSNSILKNIICRHFYSEHFDICQRLSIDREASFRLLFENMIPQIISIMIQNQFRLKRNSSSSSHQN